MTTFLHRAMWLSASDVRALAVAFGLAIFSMPGVGSASDGKALYESTCVACHGPAGKGAIPGVPDLATRLSKPDAQLVTNILNGVQTPGSPMAMPAKGGNPALTAEDAQAIVTYLRSTAAAPSAGKGTPTSPLAASSPAPSDGVLSMGTAQTNAFARGAQAWADTCARCHAMRDPKTESDRNWQVVVTHMRLRAGLDGAHADDILAFLQGSN